MSQRTWQYNFFNGRDVTGNQLTNTSLKAAPGAGLANYITDIVINAGATARTWQLLDGSGGTVLYAFTTVANNAYQCNFQVPIKLTANTALCCTNGGTSVGAGIFVNGFTARG